MPRIRLRVMEETPVTPYRYRDSADPTAGLLELPVLRLGTFARIEPRPGRSGIVRGVTAVIDTGAWISAIEADAWQRFDAAGLVEHLPFEGLPTRRASVGGLPTDYRLGRVWVSLHDLRLRQPPDSLPAVPVVAQLLLNPLISLPHPLLLGLHHGILDGRKLTREVVTPRPTPLATDRGAQYGQEWHLETP